MLEDEQRKELIADFVESIARIEKQIPRWENSNYTLPYLKRELLKHQICLATLSGELLKPKVIELSPGLSTQCVIEGGAPDARWFSEHRITQIINNAGFKVKRYKEDSCAN